MPIMRSPIHNFTRTLYNKFVYLSHYIKYFVLEVPVLYLPSLARTILFHLETCPLLNVLFTALLWFTCQPNHVPQDFTSSLYYNQDDVCHVFAYCTRTERPHRRNLRLTNIRSWLAYTWHPIHTTKNAVQRVNWMSRAYIQYRGLQQWKTIATSTLSQSWLHDT